MKVNPSETDVDTHVEDYGNLHKSIIKFPDSLPPVLMNLKIRVVFNSPNTAYKKSPGFKFWWWYRKK